MPLYYYLLFIFLILAIWLIGMLILKKRDVSYELFVEALKRENSGHLEEAAITYESALKEVKKGRFQNGLEKRIIEKLKMLNTVIQYERNLRLDRI